MEEEKKKKHPNAMAFLFGITVIIFILLLLSLLISTPECEKNTKYEGPRPVDDSVLAEVSSVLNTTLVTDVMVTDSSMYPTLTEGDICKCRKIRSLQKGDIIVYPVKEIADYYKLVMHRIVLLDSNGFLITKGDNSTQADDFLVTRDNAICEIEQRPILIRWLEGL